MEKKKNHVEKVPTGLASLNTITEVVAVLNGLTSVVVEKTDDAKSFNDLIGLGENILTRGGGIEQNTLRHAKQLFEKYATICTNQASEAEVLRERISRLSEISGRIYCF